MAEIVSLNQYRKARERAKAESRASENRVLHGRGKAEKKQDAVDREQFAESLDEHRLDRDGPPDTD